MPISSSLPQSFIMSHSLHSCHITPSLHTTSFILFHSHICTSYSTCNNFCPFIYIFLWIWLCSYQGIFHWPSHYSHHIRVNHNSSWKSTINSKVYSAILISYISRYNFLPCLHPQPLRKVISIAPRLSHIHFHLLCIFHQLYINTSKSEAFSGMGIV